MKTPRPHFPIRSLVRPITPGAPALIIAAMLLCVPVSAQDMPVSPEPEDSAPGAVTNSWSQAAAQISLLPTQKRSLVLAKDERNPYASRAPEIVIAPAESNEETETDRIRQILVGLTVSGRSYGPRGLRVLAGDIIFEIGRAVPYVLEDQTEDIVVENVSEEAVELAWLDAETGQLTGKRLKLTYDLSPRVSYVLKGQARRKSADADDTPRFAIMKPDTSSINLPEPTQITRSTKGDHDTTAELAGDIADEIRRKGQ